MTDYSEWEATNAEYLADALEWLRQRLVRMVPQERTSESGSTAITSNEQDRSIWSFFRRSNPPESLTPARVLLQLPPGDPAAGTPTEVDELRERMAKLEDSEHPPALPLLAQRLGMSRFEQNILLLCVAMELETRIAELCSRVQDNSSRPYPTFALAFALFDDPAWEALSPERPLRYYRLLEINQTGSLPLTASALRADERIVNYVKGLNYLDDRLAHLVTPMPVEARAGVPASQNQAVQTVLRTVAPPSHLPVRPTIRLEGADTTSKRGVAAAAAAALGLHAYKLNAELLPADAGELESLVRLWQRETLLLPLALYIETGADKASPTIPLASRFATRTGGLVFVDVPSAAAALDAAVTIEVAKPTPSEQRLAWQRALGDEAGDLPALLAGQFNLNLADIEDAASRGLRSDADAMQPLGQRLWRACLDKTRPGLDSLAESIDAKARWSDIVLPATEAALLRQIAAQMATRVKVYDDWGFRARMNRGLGITALFAGDSGTGKTMAAEVLANALQLHLYRIDLSAVVSKYIGETEKNLRQVFDAAENGGAILFFDEADALFGKRSEVKDSHDRYANIEINYLLQRMEAYRGLAILATNMKSALDPAFMRRLRFIVNFPFPGTAERKAIWERAFPSGVPRRGLDYDRLARFNIAGGSIHSIALNAAFLAAQSGMPVTMRCILDAARTELRKLDRPLNEADLRWVEPEGAAA